MPVSSADVKIITPGPLVTPLPPVIPPPTNSNATLGSETTNQDSQDEFSSRGSVRDHSDDVAAPGASSGTAVSSVVVPGLSIKEEPGLKEDQLAASEKEARERAKDRSERPEKSERHRDRWVLYVQRNQRTMLGGFLVTSAWCDLRLHMEEMNFRYRG